MSSSLSGSFSSHHLSLSISSFIHLITHIIHASSVHVSFIAFFSHLSLIHHLSHSFFSSVCFSSYIHLIIHLFIFSQSSFSHVTHSFTLIFLIFPHIWLVLTSGSRILVLSVVPQKPTVPTMLWGLVLLVAEVSPIF